MNHTTQENKDSYSPKDVKPFKEELFTVIKSVGSTIGDIISRKEKVSPIINENNRSSVVSVGGRVFHLLFRGSKNLHETSLKFLNLTGLKVDMSDKSIAELQKFKSFGRGVIIGNHTNGVFSDYLPIFASLGDEVLKKCIFYTANSNLDMNRREFPGLTFRSATIPKNSSSNYVGDMKKQIQEDLDKVSSEGGYIFIIPSGETNDDNAEFLSIFNRLVNGDKEIPVLSSKIEFDSRFGYKQILNSLLKRTGITARLSTRLTYSSDWKGKTGQEQRKFYNSLHDYELKKAA